MPKAANCRRPRGSLLESYWLVDAVCPIYLASVEYDSTTAEAGANVEKDYSESMDPYLWSYSSAYESVVLVFGFGLRQHGLRRDSFRQDLYFSGITFFTVGYGDLVPRSMAMKAIPWSRLVVGSAFWRWRGAVGQLGK